MAQKTKLTQFFSLSAGVPDAPVVVGRRRKEVGSAEAFGEQWHNQIYQLPANGTVRLWVRHTDPVFDFMSIHVLGSGTLDVVTIVDTPVSSSNLAKSGTREQAFVEVASCTTPVTIASCDMPISPTVLNVTDSANLPALLSASDRTRGFVYEVQVRNSSTEPVRYVLAASSGIAEGLTT